MKIKTEIITKEQFEVEIPPEELANEMGKLLKGYGYYTYESEPSLEVDDMGDEVTVNLYRSDVDWDTIMTGEFPKDLMKALKNFSQEKE